MELKVNISYGEYNKVFLQILYNGYECCYSCYKEDLAKWNQDPTRYDFKKEDIDYDEKVLEAYATLADHYTSRDEGKKALQRIRDRVDYGSWMTKRMSDGKIHR